MTCLHCGQLLVQRRGERGPHFRRRTYCDQGCYHAHRAAVAVERAATADAAERPRTCPACGATLTRHRGERPAAWRERTYCGHACFWADRRRRADETRATARWDAQPPELRAAARLNFDRPSLLRAARLAAPRVPMRDVVAVVGAVEPLIAATTRSAVLAVVAEDIRARRAQ
ncbi:MAG: hypothetical protein MUF60_09495 [Vicinamibacterales bacterium]|nr:hypothetical protein [Vicinamibacterales bacterium]